MTYSVLRRGIAGGMLALVAGGLAAPASANLFWGTPDFRGTPVNGDEPGLGLPMPGATPKEIQAHLLWNMRAGLNVAALQCQFDGPLMTVRNYNALLNNHSKELADAYTAVSGYFKRTVGPKGKWQTALDQYTTKTYNGFSTLHAQMGFCETAGSIGREALAQPKGKLHITAQNRMREFRNSLVPAHDRVLVAYSGRLAPRQLPPLAAQCWDKKGRFVSKRCGMPQVSNVMQAEAPVAASAGTQVALGTR